MKNTILLLLAVLLFACGPKEVPSIGDKHMVVFDNEHLYFDGGAFDAELDQSDKVYRIMDGRILMKKISLPSYDREVAASVKVTVASAGDRWDKSGSFFVIPEGAMPNFVSLQAGGDLPKGLEEHEGLPGVVAAGEYQPVVELMRFMTPFGIGFYNDKMDLRKPVYIPHWEDKVVWEQDITDRLSLLEGDVWVGVWIDTWTKEGYTVSAELKFDETDYLYAAKPKTGVQPLLNTIPYYRGQKHVDLFSRKDLVMKATVPAGVSNVKLNYITTGHGGHSGGDEFVKKVNIVKVDGEEVINFIPWRDDCAAFRRFNPGSGLWLIKDTATYIDSKARKYKEKVIEERLASSDLSRSNWCPGSDVQPVVVDLDVAAGEHTFTFSIPEAQEIDGDKLNHWLVSAYLTWEE
ncbi:MULTISPECIES: PNGase F N-terminal domain-containing protein [unclassified Carboxylicivirga]|uniref:PNGase F N-terminal domain-containing protein n=1 Tax=Carboxylicivirga TaxID=1628153 RepID=UPI003D34E1F7